MPSIEADELHAAFRTYWQTGAVNEDWSGWADLFTEDVHYLEHVLGVMRGREAVRAWIVPLMREYGAIYTVYRWHTLDLQRGRVIFYMDNRRDHPSGQGFIDFPGISIIEYAGDGLWSFQEDYWAVPAGTKAAKDYAAACAEHDPEHRSRRTRRDWGGGPPWTIGAPYGPGATRS